MNKQTNIRIKNNKVEIPVPDTKFIVIGKRQPDNTWNIYIQDPSNHCKTEEITTKGKNTVFKLFCATLLRATIID